MLKVEHTVCQVRRKASRISIFQRVLKPKRRHCKLLFLLFQAMFFEENIEPVMSQSILRNPTVTGRKQVNLALTFPGGRAGDADS